MVRGFPLSLRNVEGGETLHWGGLEENLRGSGLCERSVKHSRQRGMAWVPIHRRTFLFGECF
jgi:hypothetical protein